MRAFKLIIITMMLLVPISAQNLEKTIDDFITQLVNYNSFSGSVLISNKGEVILKRGYSLANREWNIPNTYDTKFRIGSITKQFTAAIILKLREEGKLTLNDKISDHVDYYRKDTGDKITIHHLLTHTSGIPSYTSHPDFFPGISVQIFDADEFAKEYCMGDLEFEPGSQFVYNNSGYYLLGIIIEKITGMTYDEALRHYILDPLEMNATGYDRFEDILEKRADGYEKFFIEYSNAPYLNMNLPYAAGGMYSTVEDLFKWDRVLYGRDLLSQESLDLFFKPYEEALGGHYAYGWVVTEVDVDADGKPDTILSHGGGINGFNTLIARIPSKEQSVIFLNNSGSAPLNFMSDQIFKIINEQEFEYPKKGIGLVLFERIEDEGIDETIIYFNQLKENNQLDVFYRDRGELNRLGYYLLKNDKPEAAKEILKLNMELYPDWYNAYDSYAEALMKTGKKEEAIEYYKKSLEMNPGNDNAVEKLKELGVEYKPKTVEVTEDLLKKYEGEYQLQPNFVLYVRPEGNKLFVRATGQPEFEVYPESETKFYYKVVEAELEFKTDDDGNVNELILYQNGAVMPANKIK